MHVYSLITRRNELQSCRQHPPPAAMSTTVLVGVGCVIFASLMAVVGYLINERQKNMEEPQRVAAAPPGTSPNIVFQERSNDVMNMNTGIFAWRIERFSRRVGVLKSYFFPTSARRDTGRWWLQLNPRDVSPGLGSRECVSVSLYGVNPMPRLVRMTLFSKDERLDTSRELVGVEFDGRATENPVWQTTLGDREFVLDPANDLLHDDVLNLECELEIEIPRRRTPAKRR